MSPETTTCLCGLVMEADDFDALGAVAIAHFAEAHADLGLTATQVANYVNALPRLTGGTERLEVIDGVVKVEPVATERLGDILAFFDHDAFADNAGWASCYCMAHHVEDVDGADRTADANRADLTERIEAGTTTGAVAYVGDKLAGWVNASPVTAYPHHADADHGGFAPDEVGAIACFVIAPPYRGHGLARRLLDAAVEQFAAAGKKAIEVYPILDPKSPAGAYRGPVPLLLEAGFEQVTEPNKSGAVVMRRVISREPGQR
jgi:GNAT superfamily N-acetyltransferase